MAAYAASKAGLIGLTQALAAELGPQGMRVNAILPGRNRYAMQLAKPRALRRKCRPSSKSRHALKRIAKPEEIAQSVLYLASDASSFITGAAMLVDGGASISRT